MSLMAITWALEAPILKKPTAKLTLSCIADHADADGFCFPSQRRLCERVGVSDRALRDSLNWLEEQGYLTRSRRERSDGSRSSDGYQLPEEAYRKIFPHPRKISPNLPEDISGHEPVTEPVNEPTPNPQVGSGVEVGGFEEVWKAWPHKHLPKSQDAARAIFSKLSVEHQALAVAHASDHIKRSGMLGKAPLIITYLKQRLFLELHDAPPLDSDGLFKITPDRPEWGDWMGWARSERGQSGVEYFLKIGFIATETRLPLTQENAA